MLRLPLLLLLPFADALIRLQWSVLFDEVDFKGVDQITTDICAAGCKIYATIAITDENKRLASNIIIENPNTKVRTSVADLSRLFMQDSKEKAYVEIGNAPTVTILNTNANKESAPLALWVVSTKSPYFNTAEVYEPLNLIRPKSIASAPITILSAYSFTAGVMPGDANAVYARAAGYDAIDRTAADDCYTVMDKDFGAPFAGFLLAINGPLLTLAFNTVKYPKSEIVLSATTPFSFDQTPFPSQPTFISSPGFMCGNAGHQMTLNFDIVMDTDGAHPVSIYDHKTTLNHPFSGNFRDRTNEVTDFKLQTYRATVTFTPSTADGFYGMRVWTSEQGGDGPTKTTTSAGESKTTTPGKDTTTSSADIRPLTVITQLDMIVLALLLLLSQADASIRLQHSILYDEEDLRGVDQITTDVCAAGCKVYATISAWDYSPEKKILGHIMIVDPKTQETTSIFDLSRFFNLDTMAKEPLEIGAAPTLTILNTNANLESAPLALWIVSANAPYYRTAEVFDPANLHKDGVVSAPITILSAALFLVTAKPGDANGVRAVAAGFDSIDKNSADNCFVAMDKDFGQPFAGFFFSINAPLLTLSFDTVKYPHSKVELSASHDLSFDQNPFANQPTFIQSAGFMCGGSASQVYRSAALNTRDTKYTLRTPNDNIMTLNFAIDMDTDAAHPVTIFDHKTRQNYTFSGNFKDGTSQVNTFNLRTYRASVIFIPGSDDVFYGMRVWAE